jgi:hypothetical protein
VPTKIFIAGTGFHESENPFLLGMMENAGAQALTWGSPLLGANSQGTPVATLTHGAR